MTDRKIMKLALEALETADEAGFWELQKTVVSALRERLAQPEQEPVAVIGNWGRVEWRDGVYPQLGDKMYPAPPQRKPLTDEQIDELSRTMVKGNKSANWLCRAIEAAHGIFKDEK